MFFKSDNTAPVSQEIIEALTNANQNYAEPYGMDNYSKHLNKMLSNLFEIEVASYMVSTGTAANSLALSAITPPYGSIFCHKTAHIYTDECGAPDLFTGGAKTILVDGAHGKINPTALENALKSLSGKFPRENKPSALSITQGTELGTVYSCREISELSQIANAFGMAVQMDGARFSNAIVSLGKSPAEITWKAGVDVLCFGATKNGAIAAEVIIFFNKNLAKDFEFRQKRSGQVFSKSRFFSSQMIAFLENDLWIKNVQTQIKWLNTLKSNY